MRKIFLIVAAMLGMLISAPAHAQTSYTLWCRAGGGMQMVVGTNAVDGRPLTWLNFHFSPMATAATVATPPQPGECSWLDRQINDAEPQLVRLYLQNVRTESTFDGGNFTAIDFSGAGAAAEDGRILWNAYRAGREFRVEIYNTGEGDMRVTRVQR
jgi:hypothetical protein